MNDLTTTIEALYGLRESKEASCLYDPSRGQYLPVQSSPLREYVQDVNRFLFAGGVSLANHTLPDSHPSNALIDQLVKVGINPYLDNLWELCAITGEILALVRFNYKNLPSLEYFDRREFTPTYDKAGKLTEVSIYTSITIDGIRYIYKVKADKSHYYEYPLVKEQYAKNYQWDSNVTLVEHNYGEVPAQVIKLNPSINSKRGKPEFNTASVNLAASIVFMEYGLDENVEFLGNPLIDSPDPRETIKALNQKKQVLQKLPSDEGGGHEILQPAPLTQHELEYLKYKKEAFKRLHGITNTQETRLNDASGIALRIMNDGLISKAQSKWSQIVEAGLNPLLDLVCRLGQAQGLYNLGSFFPKCGFYLVRKEPYFAQTEGEKIQSLEVTNRLIEMGVDRAEALKETFYTHLTLEEINAKLRVNLEDI